MQYPFQRPYCLLLRMLVVKMIVQWPATNLFVFSSRLTPLDYAIIGDHQDVAQVCRVCSRKWPKKALQAPHYNVNWPFQEKWLNNGVP